MRRIAVTLALGWLTFIGATRAVDYDAQEAALRSIDTCDSVPNRPSEVHRTTIESALQLGESALDALPNSPRAHFAVFCALAKLASLDGFTLRSLFHVRRMLSELNQALALDPAYTDALVAKGSLLLELPALLGGNPSEAERLLRQAVSREPDRIGARIPLAQALVRLGASQDAKREARTALELARAAGRDESASEALALLARIEGAATPVSPRPQP